MNIDNQSNNAILIRKEDILKYSKQFNLNVKDNLQQIYQDFVHNLNATDINQNDHILNNRSLSNSLSIDELENQIDIFLSNSQSIDQKENEIIKLLTTWLPDVNFVRIMPTFYNQEYDKRIVLECNSVFQEQKIKFYMKLIISEIGYIEQIANNQEIDFFNEISHYSAKFLSMKYQKVLSEHLIILAPTTGIQNSLNKIQSQNNEQKYQKKHYVDIVLTDYCEYSLREIIYPKPSLKRQQLPSESKENMKGIQVDLQSQNHSHQSKIEKFSYQHLQKDLVEAIFFMHTRGYTHNQITLDTIFYDKYINAFVIGGFDKMKRRVHDYESFKNDIRSLGLVLLDFFVHFHRINDDLSIRNFLSSIHLNTSHQSKKNFILLNLNIYQQRNILFDIFSSTYQSNGSNDNLKYVNTEKPFDIVELAISLNIQHCLVSSSHSLMRNFLTQNEFLDESHNSHLQDPLNNKLSYWKYVGNTKNGLFNGVGEITFDPPSYEEEIQLINDIEQQNDDFPNQQDENSDYNNIYNQSESSPTSFLKTDFSQTHSNTHVKNRQNVQQTLHIHSQNGNKNISPNGSDTKQREQQINNLNNQQIFKQKIFKGVWESGFNQKYLTFVTPDEFKQNYLLNNNMKVIAHNSHQELQFSVKSDSLQQGKTIDLQFSCDKENVIDSLNILVKYLQIPITRITYDLKGFQQRKVTNEAQIIELQVEDGGIIFIQFGGSYLIREEDIYTILEKSVISSSLTLQMTHTLICDKFFLGMQYNMKLENLSHLQISHSTKITDEGFLYFVRNCPSKHLESLDISYTQLTNTSVMELTISNKITKLTRLNLSHNPQITEQAVTEFIKSSNSLYMSHLNISALDLSDNFVEILCISPFMRNISEIIMKDCPKITFRIFEIFTKSESVNCIKRLELSYCLKHSNTALAKKTGFLTGLLDKRKSKQEFKQFAKTDKLSNLHVLNLEGCQIVHNHIKQLANSHSMKNIEEINVSNCEHFNDDCIKEICSSQNFIKLRILYLSNLKSLTSSAIEMIGNSKYLTKLDLIYLDGCENIQKNSLIMALNFSNFQNLKNLKFDENQYSIQLLRQINFSNKNSVQTFWRMQIIEIVLTNPDLFFKVNLSEMLSFNQKPIKFIINKLQEPSVIQKLATILSHQIYNFQETNCRMYVNNVLLNERMLDEIKKQKQTQVANSISNADIYNSNFKNILRTLQTDSFKKDSSFEQPSVLGDNTPESRQTSKTFTQAPTFSGQKIYCRNECFKAMHYVKFIEDLKKFDLSFCKNINLPGYQFIKECVFFPNIIELNLQNLPILNKHAKQMCFGIQFTSLRILNLKNCFYLNFQGFENFLNSGIFQTLQFLDVSSSQIEGTDFTLCLPDFKYLSQLNGGNINIQLCKFEVTDEEYVKKKLSAIFQKIKTFFYINQLSFVIRKLKITSQVLLGIASILMDHFNTITTLQIIFCNAKNMNSEQSINFWSSIAQLVKLKSLCLVFQSCKSIDKLFLKNLFFGISVLSSMDELNLSFPKTEMNIPHEELISLCMPMIRLQQIQILQVNFHEIFIFIFIFKYEDYLQLIINLWKNLHQYQENLKILRIFHQIIRGMQIFRCQIFRKYLNPLKHLE